VVALGHHFGVAFGSNHHQRHRGSEHQHVYPDSLVAYSAHNHESTHGVEIGKRVDPADRLQPTGHHGQGVDGGACEEQRHVRI